MRDRLRWSAFVPMMERPVDETSAGPNPLVEAPMCGILAILGVQGDADTLRPRALSLSRRLRHRGPDWSGVHADDRAILAHERLAIVDVDHGAQPLVNPAGDRFLCVNGEIYNHRDLRHGLAAPYAFTTDSDCEVILALYEQGVPPAALLERLSGIFAFVL